MINSKLWPTVFFGIACLATACTKESGKEIIEPDLIGTWEWVRTDGGIAFHIHDTPASTGNNIDLKIASDGRYYIYTNGALTAEGTYSLEKRKCIHDHADKTVINFSSASVQDMMIEKVDQVNLEVADENYDGLGSLHKRKPNGN